MIKLPEGVEIALSLFITSDEADTDMEYKVSGLPVVPDEFLDLVDITKLELPDIADDWRVMTRAEIKEYKLKEREDVTSLA